MWYFAKKRSNKTRFRLTTSETTKYFKEEKCFLVQSFLLVNAPVVNTFEKCRSVEFRNNSINGFKVIFGAWFKFDFADTILDREEYEEITVTHSEDKTQRYIELETEDLRGEFQNFCSV